MAISKTSKSGNTKVSTKRRDLIFDTVDAIQNSRRREALTYLKDILDPANDAETQKYIAKCSSVVTDSGAQSSPAHKSPQNCWRLPFRGLSHQVYAIIREEFILTSSFNAVLHRLDVSLCEHPKQARKLAEEGKVLRSKGTNDMRAWTQSSDDLLQQSFTKRAELAWSYEGQLADSLQETTLVTSAFSTLQEDADNLVPADSDSVRRHELIMKGANDEDVYLRETCDRKSSVDTFENQDTVQQNTLGDDSGGAPLHHNTNRQSDPLRSWESSRLRTDALERSALSAWKLSAGRKKSWKFCPTQKLPTRRKCKGYRGSTFDIEDLALSENSSSVEESSTLDSAPGPKPAQWARHGQQAYKNRDALQAKRSGRKESAWTWNRSFTMLSNDPSDLMATGRCPSLHRYPHERKSTKVIISRGFKVKDHRSSHTFKKSSALTKSAIVKKSPLISSPIPEEPRVRPMQREIFAKEKTIFESLLLTIPESLPGSCPKKQKRRGVNKIKIPEFSNTKSLLSFLQTSWLQLLERMAEMKDSVHQGWDGTQESYSRKRRTFQVYKKQLEDLETVYPLAQNLETQHYRADMLIRKEVKKLEIYVTWIDQSQRELMDFSWSMRKQPGAALIMAEPLLHPSDYSELMRHGIIRYHDDESFRFEHWASQETSVFIRVEKAYKIWCQVSEDFIRSLLNSRRSVAT